MINNIFFDKTNKKSTNQTIRNHLHQILYISAPYISKPKLAKNQKLNRMKISKKWSYEDKNYLENVTLINKKSFIYIIMIEINLYVRKKVIK